MRRLRKQQVEALIHGSAFQYRRCCRITCRLEQRQTIRVMPLCKLVRHRVDEVACTALGRVVVTTEEGRADVTLQLKHHQLHGAQRAHEDCVQDVDLHNAALGEPGREHPNALNALRVAVQLGQQ